MHYVYVGKTSAVHFSKVYWRHINGKIEATESYFDAENKPCAHMLSEHTLTTADAYKHIIAYVHLFQKAGYFCLNYNGTLHHAAHPMPETLEIIHALEREPLDDLLARTKLKKHTDADRKIAKTKEQPADINFQSNASTETSKAPIQMNVRIKPEDKIQFDNYRKQLNLNQQEAFSLLLDQIDNRQYEDLLTKKDNQIQKLKKENEKLKKKLSREEISIPQPEQKARAFLSFAKDGITYYESLLPLPSNVPPLPRHSYRFFTKKVLTGLPYRYPEKDGYTVLNLEKILWSNGRNRACFLLGTDENGHRIRLRYYPKEYHLMCSFLRSKQAFLNARWLVGYQLAKDQAMEVVFAIPLPSKVFSQTPNQSTDITIHHPEKHQSSLQDLITQAYRKR